MPDPARVRLTYAEYLALERASETKHEYIDGAIVALAGGTIEHGRLAARLIQLVGTALRDRPCDTFTSDVRVRVPSGDSFYPDVTIVCGKLQPDSDDRDAITNPIVIVEVLSTSTEGNDRGPKFRHYRKLPSLREYVLVYQTEPFVEVWRLSADRWSLVQEAGPGAVIELASVDAKLSVDELYRDPLGA